MRRHILILFTSFLVCGLALSQDNITRLHGEYVECKITSVDSSTIYLLITNGGNEFNTSILLKDVSSYTWNGQEYFIQAKIDPVSANSATTNFYYPQQLKRYADSIENLNRNFAFKWNGEILYGNIIEYDDSFFGPTVIRVDRKEFDVKNIKFYKNETGFYANLSSVTNGSSNYFTERIRKGKINLYEKVTTNYSPGFYNGSTGMYMGGSSSTRIKNYYNIGFEDLKKANYKNLSVDLSGNTESMMYLERYKQKSKNQTILTIVGSGLIAASIITFIASTNTSENETTENDSPPAGIIVPALIGSGCFWASYFISLSKPRLLRNAIDAYNY